MAITNGVNADKLKGALERIDTQDDELASLKGQYMRDCVHPRAIIKEIKGEIREAGYSMSAFKEILRKHRDERARAKRIAALEDDARSELEQMAEALGDFIDLPLGQAAMARAKDGEILDSLTS